ncbi:MAG: AI-2E family transporter [Myxococcota bacterium]
MAVDLARLVHFAIMNLMDPVRWLLSILVVVAIGHVLVVARSIILPLVAAIFLWYLLSALVDLMSDLPVSLPYPVRLGLAVLLVVGVIASLSIVAATSVRSLGDQLPFYQAELSTIFQELLAGLGLPAQLLRQELLPTNINGLLSQALSGVTFTLSQLGAVLLYTAFLLAEAHTFEMKARALMLGPQRELALLQASRQIAGQIRFYVALKSLTSALIGVISFAILWSFDVQFAAFWGVTTFVFNFVPYIGSFLAVLMPILLSVLQFDAVTTTLLLAGLLIFAQILVGNVFEPRLMGRQLNLSPLVILLSLAVWGSLWGVPGMFFSVPLMVTSMIVLSEFETTKPIAILLSERGDT